MAGQSAAQTREKKKSDELIGASLTFKEFILSKTASLEVSPRADLYRVNLLGQMLDKCDEFMDNGLSVNAAVRQTMAFYGDIEERMLAQGFAEREDLGGALRWPKLTEEEAVEFIKENQQNMHKRALGIALCVGCCFPMLIIDAVVDFLGLWMMEDFLMNIGVIGLFGLIGLGVYLIITGGRVRNEKISKGRYTLGARLRRQLGQLKEATEEKGKRRVAKGVLLETCSIVPVVIGGSLDNFINGLGFFGVASMFVMIAAGVYEQVMSSSEKKTIRELLLHEDQLISR